MCACVYYCARQHRCSSFRRNFHPCRRRGRFCMRARDCGGRDPVQDVPRVGGEEGQPEPQRPLPAWRWYHCAVVQSPDGPLTSRLPWTTKHLPHSAKPTRRQGSPLFRAGAAAAAAAGATTAAHLGFEGSVEVLKVCSCVRARAPGAAAYLRRAWADGRNVRARTPLTLHGRRRPLTVPLTAGAGPLPIEVRQPRSVNES